MPIPDIPKSSTTSRRTTCHRSILEVIREKAEYDRAVFVAEDNLKARQIILARMARTNNAILEGLSITDSADNESENLEALQSFL
jgi:hypothetical protein